MRTLNFDSDRPRFKVFNFDINTSTTVLQKLFPRWQLKLLIFYKCLIMDWVRMVVTEIPWSKVYSTAVGLAGLNTSI